MIITHNASAMNSRLHLSRNQKKTAAALEKLSSGLKINKAADDAAGLAISEKMRAQIRGLSQASRNVQDGISLIQTAEGGLSHILEPSLQRLRELTIQAGNGTLTEKDRRMIQDEVKQILGEIDQIAQGTEFNGKKLLDGTYKKPVENVALTQEWTVNFSGKEIVSLTATADGGVVAAGRKGQFGSDSQYWLTKVDTAGNALWETLLPQDDSYNVIYNVQSLQDGSLIASARRRNLLSGKDDAVLYKLSANGEILGTKVLAHGDEQLLEIKETKEGDLIAVGVASQDVIVRKLDSSFNVIAVKNFTRPSGSYFKTGIDVTQTRDGGFWMVGEESYSSPSFSNGFIMKLDANLNLQWESKEANTVFLAVASIDDQHGLLLGNTGLYSIDDTGTITQLNAAIAQTVDSFDYKHDWLTKTTDGKYLVGTSDKLYKVTGEGEILWDLDIPAIAITQMSDRGYIVADTAHSIVKITPEDLPEGEKQNGLQIQTGANAGNTLTLYLNDASTQALGIHGLDLTGVNQLDTALAKIDTAIQKVSGDRSSLGAYQNALERINSNVMNAEENLTAAESQIRDVDMAKAMMEYTKFNMLQQVGQSMLVQANQEPQAVLSLLD